MVCSIALSRIIQDTCGNTFKLIDLLLNERKLGSINDAERRVINDVVNRIADREFPDNTKIIEEQRKKIKELEDVLYQQSFELISEESRKLVRAIRSENEKLKSEIACLYDKIQLIENEEPVDERMRQVKARYIIELVSENNRLKRENNEFKDLADLGQKMREQQKKGRRKRKDINDSEIKKLLALGFNSHQIFRKFIEEGKSLSFQTVRNRIEAMEKEGVIHEL